MRAKRRVGEPRATPPARGPTLLAWRFDLGEDAYALLECTPPGANVLLDRLTPAERNVARLVARGLGNAEIARRRGSAARTVANQAASVYRKLGVRSRLELDVLVALGGDDEP